MKSPQKKGQDDKKENAINDFYFFYFHFKIFLACVSGKPKTIAESFRENIEEKERQRMSDRKRNAVHQKNV